MIGLCDVYADALQIIGLSIESISGIYEGEKGQLINSVGHWIQFLGATLAALCQEINNPFFTIKRLDDSLDKYNYSFYLSYNLYKS
ncbi:DUF6944 family repetitive protein [Bacillus sp. 1P06AnD]|uniref:DUF6944 family repetitive protein n=1 Tax=Bacillus sp. 1P06AnD TaxID=3132208 RepID=UPI0039A39981